MAGLYNNLIFRKSHKVFWTSENAASDPRGSENQSFSFGIQKEKV